MSPESKAMSWWDAARFHALVTLPAALLGLVAPNRFVLAWFARWDPARFAARFVAGLQRKYRCGRLWLWFPFARTLLVLDRESIDAVLKSRDNAADPRLKKAALSRFVPDALVISSGEAWADRRRFNEQVLGFAPPLPDAQTFKDIAFGAAAQWTSEREFRACWSDLERLALRISHEVLLGAGQVQPDLAAQLARMATAANVLLGRRRDFAAFYAQLERLLQRQRTAPSGAQPTNADAAPAACLLRRAARLQDDGRTTSSTCVPSQVGFWFFVLKDAIELHVARTLALIAIHPDIQDRVRRDVPAQDDARRAAGALPVRARAAVIAAGPHSLRVRSFRHRTACARRRSTMSNRQSPERRQLSVMLCDLVGWSSLTQRLDAEELAEVVQAYRRRCGSLVVRHGGIVAQYVGACLRTSATRAPTKTMRSARSGRPSRSRHPSRRDRPRKSTSALRPASSSSATCWIPQRSPRRSTWTPALRPSALNLAARLQTLAGPDMVVVSDTTRRLAGGIFEYKDLGWFDLKGFDRPIQAWHVLGESAVRSRFKALRSVALTPLVDR